MIIDIASAGEKIVALGTILMNVCVFVLRICAIKKNRMVISMDFLVISPGIGIYKIRQLTKNYLGNPKKN